MRLRARSYPLHILFSIVLFSGPVFAQGPPRNVVLVLQPEIRTRLEALLNRTNTALVVDYYRIDLRFGPDVRVDAVIAQAVGTDLRATGVRIQVRDDAKPSRTAGTSFLDDDEIAGFSRALTAIADASARWTGQDDRRANELTYMSAGGLRLAVNSFGRAQRLWLSTGLTDPVFTALDVTELATLKAAMDQALAVINSK